jgi:mannose-6-phosphate isomerase-like protein (cupin superfamily)
MSHVNNIVKKPWGYEYLAYENEHVALWFLYISKDQRTSMHCHPSKTTGLVVLDGGAEISFLNNKFPMSPINKMMIRKGLFHSTQATDSRGAWVLEIETPVDKQDLVRFRDSYGREGKPYEDSTFEMPKQDDCLWIEEPETGAENVYNFANCQLTVTSVSDIGYFDGLPDETNVVFLRGGIIADYGINVAGAGDIVVSRTLKDLTKVFEKVDSNTIVMTMEKTKND